MTKDIPLVRRWGGRTFEAVIGHCGRGGRGESAGPVFAFEGTRSSELKSIAALALADQVYVGRGEVTVITDGEECLKRLAGMLLQPATHILDWFHISMKLQPIAQMASATTEKYPSFEQDIDRIKWRLWNGQPKRALALIANIRRQLFSEIDHCLWCRRADELLERVQTYVSRNRSSIVNYAERHRAGKRIATSPAEASVNVLVAKQMDFGTLQPETNACEERDAVARRLRTAAGNENRGCLENSGRSTHLSCIYEKICSYM